MEKLKFILKNAIETVPFYIEKRIKLDWQHFSFKELNKFPVITKDQIRKAPDKFVSYKNKNRGILAKTSGSSGQKFEFLLPYDSDCYEDIFSSRARTMGEGYDYFLNDPIILLRTYAPQKDEPLYRIDKKNNLFYLSPFDINEKNLDLYLKIINESKAKMIRGYPSSIYIFTLLLREKNIKLPQIKVLFTSSETLLPSFRETIESYWDIPVLDWYGQNERTVTVQQCWAGNYHNNDEYGIVQLDDDNQIIATSLYNNVMPFIRYATGDIAVPLDKAIDKCPCGRTLSIPFKSIEGRSDDILVKVDGTKIPTINMYTVMHGFPKIKQFRIVQNIDTSLTLYLLPNQTLSAEDVSDIEKAIKQRTGDLQIETKIVKEITRNRKTGKIKVIESLGA
ncbi:hypothetical protein ACFLZV_03210 [Candidatus Margulisiibacteriota bacterium]